MADTKIDDGGPANGWVQGNTDLSIRDWFAGMALQGVLADSALRTVGEEVAGSPNAAMLVDTDAIESVVNEQIAVRMYRIADAMIEARKK